MVDGSLEAGEAPRLDKKGGKESRRLSGPLSRVVTLKDECVLAQHTTLGPLLPFIANQNPPLSEKNAQTGLQTHTFKM